MSGNLVFIIMVIVIVSFIVIGMQIDKTRKKQAVEILNQNQNIQNLLSISTKNDFYVYARHYRTYLNNDSNNVRLLEEYLGGKRKLLAYGKYIIDYFYENQHKMLVMEDYLELKQRVENKK